MAKRNTTGEVLPELLASLIRVRTAYQAELSECGLSALPRGAREFVRAAQAALSEAESAIQATARDVPGIMDDIRVYPEGRTAAARAQIGGLEQVVADKTAAAERALTAARQVLTQSALRPLSARQEMTARHDALMILDRTEPGHRDAAMAELARRQDDVGALVSSGWGRDYLATITPDPVLADEMHGSVVRSAVEAAAAQNADETRRDAARHIEPLDVLHGLRDGVMHTGRLVAEALRDDHGLPRPIEGAVPRAVSGSDLDAMADGGGAIVSEAPIPTSVVF